MKLIESQGWSRTESGCACEQEYVRYAASDSFRTFQQIWPKGSVSWLNAAGFGDTGQCSHNFCVPALPASARGIQISHSNGGLVVGAVWCPTACEPPG